MVVEDPADEVAVPEERVGAARLLGEAILRSYAQILLGRSMVIGALLLAATMVVPQVGLFGLGSVLVGAGVAWMLKLSPDSLRSGLLTYSALLVGVGSGALFEPSLSSVGLVIIGAGASVMATAAFHTAMGAVFGLPALTLPFLLVFWLLLGAAPRFGIMMRSLETVPFGLVELPLFLDTFLQSFGALFFTPRADVGLVVLLALLIGSRIATVLAVLAWGLAWVMVSQVVGVVDPLLPMIMGYNIILVAIAFGGIWFVPSTVSFLLALGASLVAGVLAIGLMPVMTATGLPLLILPFNLTVLLGLYAMRQRTRDGAPKAVDFMLGTPEENLNHYRTRLERFGSRYAIRFAAPFRGRWRCTQGVDGSHTHRGPWRHAFDFEVPGPDGKLHKGTGSQLRDYHCYRLPVLATADGTVVKVIDGIPDNQIGKVDLEDNWGNVVILQHGPWLFSLVAHLVPRSIKIREGEFVRQGDQLGLCGSSGRSPTPHLHYQLQATGRVSSPTLEGELADVVVRREDHEHLSPTVIPAEGDELRNVEPEDDLAHLLKLPYGKPITFRVTSPSGHVRTETVVADIDLAGTWLLRSKEKGSLLYFDPGDRLFTIYDTLGSNRSVLHLMHAALARLPLEDGGTMRWTDHLPLRRFVPRWVSVLLDAVSPFIPGKGIEMTYSNHRDGRALVVEGRSKVEEKGEAIVQTKARLEAMKGITELTLITRGRTWKAELEEPKDPRSRE